MARATATTAVLKRNPWWCDGDQAARLRLRHGGGCSKRRRTRRKRMKLRRSDTRKLCCMQNTTTMTERPLRSRRWKPSRQQRLHRPPLHRSLLAARAPAAAPPCALRRRTRTWMLLIPRRCHLRNRMMPRPPPPPPRPHPLSPSRCPWVRDRSSAARGERCRRHRGFFLSAVWLKSCATVPQVFCRWMTTSRSRAPQRTERGTAASAQERRMKSRLLRRRQVAPCDPASAMGQLGWTCRRNDPRSPSKPPHAH